MAALGEVVLVKLRGRKVRGGLFVAGTQALRMSLRDEESHKELLFDDIPFFSSYLLCLLVCKWKSKYLLTLLYDKNGV